MTKISANPRDVTDPETIPRVASQDNPGFAPIYTLLPTIDVPFLKDRMTAYVRSAHALFNLLCNHTDKITTHVGKAELTTKLQLFGKNARVIDLILAVAGTAGYLSPHSKALAQHIRVAVEVILEPFLQRQPDGVFLVATASGPLRAETFSPTGRRIARLLARFVPPAKGDTSRAPFLSPAEDQKIKQSLKDAEASQQKGQTAEAESLYKEILAISRKNPEALRGLGLLYLAQRSFTLAIPFLKEALLFYPQDVTLINLLGEALCKENKFAEAIECHREAVRLQPDNAASLAKLGKALMLGGHDGETRSILEKAVALAPNAVEPLINLGIYFQTNRHIDEAMSLYRKALHLSPNNILALINMGTLCVQQGKNAEGLKYMTLAQQVEPHSKDLQFMKSQLLLTEGHYEEGWALYESGLGSKDWRGNDLVPHLKHWKGEADPKLKLLICREQGLGDVLQFVRYAALCKPLVGEVHVLCSESLASLLAACPFIDRVVTEARAETYDAQISMMSLPYVFKTTLETIPATIPYLFVPQSSQRAWAGKFDPADKRLKVGLVWSGSMFSSRVRGDLAAKSRNMELEQLKPLLDLEGVHFYSLQLGDASQKIDALNLRGRVTDYMTEVKTMADTAALIENLDLVITVDTSVAHLAGGLGKPVWVMSRYNGCWRWLNNRPNSPWYPQGRVFGQPRPNDWQSVVDEIHKALREKITARG